MSNVTVLIFHRPAAEGESKLVRSLAEIGPGSTGTPGMFERAGASAVQLLTEWHEALRRARC